MYLKKALDIQSKLETKTIRLMEPPTKIKEPRPMKRAWDNKIHENKNKGVLNKLGMKKTSMNSGKNMKNINGSKDVGKR